MVFIMPVMATTFMIFKPNCFLFVVVFVLFYWVFGVFVVYAVNDEKLCLYDFTHKCINRVITTKNIFLLHPLKYVKYKTINLKIMQNKIKK